MDQLQEGGPRLLTLADAEPVMQAVQLLHPPWCSSIQISQHRAGNWIVANQHLGDTVSLVQIADCLDVPPASCLPVIGGAAFTATGLLVPLWWPLGVLMGGSWGGGDGDTAQSARGDGAD